MAASVTEITSKPIRLRAQPQIVVVVEAPKALLVVGPRMMILPPTLRQPPPVLTPVLVPDLALH
jgi:hypothetical protein